MSDPVLNADDKKLWAFKNQIIELLCPVEDVLRDLWPEHKLQYTLLVRTPWLPVGFGSVWCSNIPLEEAVAELLRLSSQRGGTQ